MPCFGFKQDTTATAAILQCQRPHVLPASVYPSASERTGKAQYMPLIRFNAVSLDFAEHKILTEADFSIEPGERVCLIGRNGAGKSTTFKLIAGSITEDHGEIVRQTGLTITEGVFLSPVRRVILAKMYKNHHKSHLLHPCCRALSRHSVHPWTLS